MGDGQETSSLDADSSGGLVTCARLAPSCRASWSRKALFSAHRRVISAPAASKRRELTLPGRRPQGRGGASGQRCRGARRTQADQGLTTFSVRRNSPAADLSVREVEGCRGPDFQKVHPKERRVVRFVGLTCSTQPKDRRRPVRKRHTAGSQRDPVPVFGRDLSMYVGLGASKR